MANEQDRNLKPETSTEADISKAQMQQQAERKAQQRSEERGEAESGFVGADGRRDTSSELIEEEESTDEQSRKVSDAE